MHGSLCAIVFGQMISTAEFKKQIGQSLGQQLRDLGFKGSGFDYLMDTEDFLFAIGIQGNRYGGQCCVELGIQPKNLNTDGSRFLDFKKMKYVDCEFRTRLSPRGQGDFWWTYDDDENKNRKLADDIVQTIRDFAIPVIKKIKDNPDFLEEIEPEDLDNLYNGKFNKLNGLNLMTTEIRMAWALTKALEKKNFLKAKMFAQYGLSKIEYPSSFFGIEYFEEIVNKNNSA